MVKTTLAIAAAMAVVCARAEAAVYTFVPTLADGTSPFITPDNLSFTISISDAAVRSGSFSYNVGYSYNAGSNSFVSAATGDVSSFQSFRSNTGNVFLLPNRPVSGFYEDRFGVNLAFNASGQVTAGNVDYSTDSYYVFIRGTDATFSGTAGFGSMAAKVSGPLVGGLSSVPEPATLGILAAALGCCLRLRRQTIASVSNDDQ